MRYTEVRLSKIAEEMLEDIEKNTVDFATNYDGSLKEPLCCLQNCLTFSSMAPQALPWEWPPIFAHIISRGAMWCYRSSH